MLLIAAPRAGGALFGIPAADPALPYLRALGFRDLALALYLAGHVLRGDRGGLRLVLVASALIPVCDVVLVAAHQGLSAWLNLLLHVAGAAALLGTAALLRDAGR